MRGLCKWAADAEHVASDRTRDVGDAEGQNHRFPAWTEADIERFASRWPIGTREQIAFDVLLYTGLRRGDAVILGRQHVRDGIFTVGVKTGAEVTVQILAPLAQSLAAGPTGDLHFIVGERGQPLTKESFGNWFGEACREAGVRKSAHETMSRGPRIERVANTGATTDQLKAVFGWTDEKMPSLYPRGGADRKRLAQDALRRLAADLEAKLEPNNPNTFSPQP